MLSGASLWCRALTSSDDKELAHTWAAELAACETFGAYQKHPEALDYLALSLLSLASNPLAAGWEVGVWLLKK